MRVIFTEKDIRAGMYIHRNAYTDGKGYSLGGLYKIGWTVNGKSTASMISMTDGMIVEHSKYELATKLNDDNQGYQILNAAEAGKVLIEYYKENI